MNDRRPELLKLERAAEFSMMALDALSRAYGPHFYQHRLPGHRIRPRSNVGAARSVAALAADMGHPLSLHGTRVSAGFIETGDVTLDAGRIGVRVTVKKRIKRVSVPARRP